MVVAAWSHRRDGIWAVSDLRMNYVRWCDCRLKRKRKTRGTLQNSWTSST